MKTKMNVKATGHIVKKEDIKKEPKKDIKKR